MLESIFLAVAEAVFSYVITTLDPVQPIKKRLGREPARLAFQKALSRAYSAFARQYPEYTASLFDQTFLTGAGAPELAKLLTRHLTPDPAIFAQAWGTSIGLDINSPFCREATKPAADFLNWLETELKSETVFQPIFDSRALESLPNLENQLEKLTAELKRGLDAALKTATDYEKIVLDISGDVSGSNIITGNDNQITVSNIFNHYHTGAFATLSDYYIAPDAVFQRVRVDEFVGRDWLSAKVDAFLNDPDNRSGIFLLIGEAGVGKTSFMAHLVRERRYLHLFAEQAPGDANLRRALQSLGSQLVTRHQIAPYKDRDTLTQLAEFPDFLDKLLRLAANTLAKGEKIVIVCDALDEAGTAPDGNVFGVPNVLPDNVYFILSQRPVSTKLPNVPTCKETLEARGDENLQDMEDYLKALCKRPEIAGQLRAKNYSDEFFVQTLKEKSLGVWMYLHYIIEEIGKGSRAPLELENLPTGLVGYYADHWNDWREGRNGHGEGPQKWDELYAPLLTTLAAAQEPVTIEQIMKWSGVQTRQREVLRLLNEHWRSFLTIRKEQGNTLYAPYHASFRDFLTGKVDFTQLRSAENYLVEDLAGHTKDAHQRIVDAFREECDGVWHELVEDDYPRLYLTTHLDEAGEHQTLKNLLTEGTKNIPWAEARYKKEETHAGYLNDLEHVWNIAGKTDDLGLQIRCMLIENSIRSLAKNILPNLLAELAKSGMWSYPRCLATIKQMPDANQQAEAIELLLPTLPTTLLEQILSAAREIKDESARARAFSALAPHLTDELKLQLLSAAREIKDEDARARAFSALAPHLTDELKLQLLSAAREIKAEYARASAFSEIAPHLTDELKLTVLSEALSAAREIKDESARAYIFVTLAPHLTDELKLTVLSEALSAAREIKDEYARAYIFVTLAPHLTDELKLTVLSEALSAAREIKDEDARARAFSALAPHLMGDRKVEMLIEALFCSQDSFQIEQIMEEWKTVDYDGFQEKASEFLRKVSSKDREEGISTVKELLPALQHIGDEKITGDIVRAILDTVHWWP
ncbi:MAG: AAA family ATPase [Anaerolineales bacterium]|nr:MAG: AAA family ATPase [Anaerolineales bacterium]